MSCYTNDYLTAIGLSEPIRQKLTGLSRNSINTVTGTWSVILRFVLHLLINLRSPRDYVGPPFVRSFALSPLDGASVREAHCEQASTAVRKAHCAQATVARLVTFESLKWKYSFATI